MLENTDDPGAAAVFDFIDEYLGDVERGRTHLLTHYLARYPAHQDRVAREYLALKDPSPAFSPGVAPLSDAATVPGAERVGPYRLVRELGRGGQGAVFLAEDVRIARRVALKILTERFETHSQDHRKRFRREAEVIARLEHPSICGIYDADLEGGRPYIAMRYVEGATLAQLIADTKAKTDSERAGAAPVADDADSDAPTDLGRLRLLPHRSLDVRRVLHLFERTARALHAAHEAGVVHRDVKPGNIIVAGDGTPVVLDFGLARDEHSELAGLTQSDEVFGTPAYMSPEQLRGSSEHLDRRTDVYSLGVALYEALTLCRPFEAPQRMALYRAIEHDPMPDPRAHNPALGEDVKVVLETALEKDRSRRYATALELAEDLRRIREYEPIRARPAGVGLRFARWTRRHPALAVSIIGTILALSAGLSVSVWLLAREQRALSFALERQLAERSVLLIPEDPSCALALGIDAAELALASGEDTNYLTRMALLSALDACYMSHELVNVPARTVEAMAVSPDTRTLAVALEDGSARLWDVDSGAMRARLEGDAGQLGTIAYSPDGELLATGSVQGRVEIWQTKSHSSLQRLELGSPIATVEFSCDGTRLLVVTGKGRATIFDAHAWIESFALDDGDAGVAQARFAPDGERILTAPAPDHANANRATLWDGRDGRRLVELTGHSSAILACDFVPDPAQHVAATGSQDKSVRLWNSDTGEPLAEPMLFDAGVQRVVFSPDGHHLASMEQGDSESWCTLTDLASGVRVKLSGHGGRRVVHAAFSPNSARLATVAYDNTVRVWDARTGEPELRFDGVYRSLGVQWALDSRRLATRSNGCVVHIWYAVDRPDTFDLKGHTQAVRAVAFSPDGSLALTASDDASARLWSVAGAAEQEPRHLLQILEHPGPVRQARFSSDGAALLTVSDTAVRVWRSRDANANCTVLEHPEPVKQAQFDSDGTRVLSVCEDGRARIWRVDGVGEPIVLGIEGAAITCARFSRDARLVAAGFTDDRVCVWNADDGALLSRIDYTSTFDGKRGVADIDLHPRIDEVAAACADRILRFWNPHTGQPTRPDVWLFEPQSLSYSRDGEQLLITGGPRGGAVRVQHLDTNTSSQPDNVHDSGITTGMLSADGRLVLTGSRDCTLYVWDAATGRPLVRRVGADSPVLCAAFNTDGSNLRVICGRENGVVSIWPVDPLPAARARKPRELTPGERLRESRLARPLVYE